MSDSKDPIGSWQEDREHKRLVGLDVSADERIAWLEEMIALAFASGALPKPRDEWGQSIDSRSTPRRSGPST